jgi:hypothetical protein
MTYFHNLLIHSKLYLKVIRNDKSLNINYEDQHKIQGLDQISPMPSKRLFSKSSQESDDFMVKFFDTPAKNLKQTLKVEHIYPFIHHLIF